MQPNTSVIKALIFDFFGVVGQSTYAYIADKYSPSNDQSRQLTDLHRSLDYGFVTYNEFINQYAEILQVNNHEIKEIFTDAKQHFHTSKVLLDFIDQNRQVFKMALLSNVSGEAFKTFILPIEHHFDVVVTSYSVEMAKPDIEIFTYTANKLQLDSSECIMIDDNATNCEGARAAGMSAIQYASFDSFTDELKQYI